MKRATRNALVVGGIAALVLHRPLLISAIKARHGKVYPWVNGKSYDSTNQPWEWNRGFTPKRWASFSTPRLWFMLTKPEQDAALGAPRPLGSWVISADQQP